MNHRKLAALAGVSPATVSKALSGSREISPETSARVRSLAEETGYLAEKRKRQLEASAGREPRVAILCPELVSVHYAQSVTSLWQAVRAQGGKSSVYITGFSPEASAALAEGLAISGDADGILCLSMTAPLQALAIPLVYCVDIRPKTAYDTVYSDMEQGCREAFGRLQAAGHRKIGFVGEDNTLTKEAFFRQLAAEAGLPLREEWIFRNDRRFEAVGEAAAEALAALQEPPTAVMTAYDEVALGLIHGLTTLGWELPRQLSVVGFNDIPGAAYANPPLTTVRTYSEECMRLAAERLLLRCRNRRELPVQHTAVRCKWMERGTVAPPEEG